MFNEIFTCSKLFLLYTSGQLFKVSYISISIYMYAYICIYEEKEYSIKERERPVERVFYKNI